MYVLDSIGQDRIRYSIHLLHWDEGVGLSSPILSYPLLSSPDLSSPISRIPLELPGKAGRESEIWKSPKSPRHQRRQQRSPATRHQQRVLSSLSSHQPPAVVAASCELRRLLMRRCNR